MVRFQLLMTDVTATTACHQTIRIVSTVILTVHMFHPVSRDGQSRDYQDAGGATSTSCTLELLHDLRHSAGHMGDRQTYETCYPFISWTEVLTNQTRKGKHSSMLGIKTFLSRQCAIAGENHDYNSQSSEHAVKAPSEFVCTNVVRPRRHNRGISINKLFEGLTACR